ncbi:MAG: CPBP family intramembrane metalloprotease, partial [Bacteriovoracaceae bacterium]|nr:CPBP family intramembrane metalloprotease [Bacteriovoracaceae bacterium]
LLLLIFFCCFELAIVHLFQLTAKTQYIIEACFMALTYYSFKKRPKWHWKLTSIIAVDFLILFLCGFLTYRLAAWVQLPIPFDAPTAMTFFMLIIFAPIWEELLYRGALVEVLSRAFTQKYAFWINCLLFSLGHLVAVFLVPAEFRIFVYYQALYTFALAWWLNRKREKLISLNFVMVDHFAFNLGFALALSQLL